MRIHASLVAAAVGLVCAQGAFAQATVKPDGQWRAVLGLGASLSKGNTDASNLSLVSDGVRATANDKTTWYGNAQFARSSGTTTSEQIRFGGRYDQNLSQSLFAFGGLDFERNKFANLKLRSQLSAGLGYHLIATPATTWDVFGGLTYSADQLLAKTLIDGSLRSSYNYPSLMLGEESNHKLSDTTTARQRFVMYPNLKDTGEYRATFDAGVAVAMTKTMNLNVGMQMNYNSQPGVGRKSTDTLLTTGVSMKFE
jgi:putative salt-induced outer membrane protein YdiY